MKVCRYCKVEGCCIPCGDMGFDDEPPAVPEAPALPEGWFPAYDSYRHANAHGGCEVSFKAGQLHVSEVYVDATKPLGFSVPLPVLRALLATQGLSIIGAKDRAVLEAMAALYPAELEQGLHQDSIERIIEAELARREP